ncbi:MAG: membrane protein FxsA [Calditrichaeota bacterium]|nr:membrane protein FxsA [Calditrichota bacterium]MCB0267061.1 membrane protein FxsA [Calditrichota bacterium]
MFAKLLFIFVTIPLVEMLILIKLGEAIGFWPTMAMVVVTGIIGASLAKAQGFLALNRIRSELNTGKLPADELVDGLLILIGGIVLLTPGLLTDLAGFSLMVPAIRTVIRKWLQRRFKGMLSNRNNIFVSGFSQKPEYTDDFRIEE